MAKQKCPECEKCPPDMATFADLMSLLLTFFVLLVSMANFEVTKFKMTVQSLQGAFGVMESYPTIPVHTYMQIPKKSGDEKAKKNSLKDAEKVKQTIESKNMEDAVTVKVTDTGLHILLKDPVAFSSGSADLQNKGKEILTDIGGIIKQNENIKIRVEGHTDDIPVNGGKFGSNWALSSARALSVVQTLSDGTGINPANMSAVGYGEFRPMVDNVNPKSRAENRRIEIFVDYVQK